MKKVFFFLCWLFLSAVEIQTLIVANPEDGALSDLLNLKNKRRLEKYIGKEIEQSTLLQIKEEVLAALRVQGDYVVNAYFPKQDVSSGSILLHVAMPKVDRFEIKGNQWEKEEFYRQQFDVSSGDVLQTSDLLNDVAWLNRNPFRYAEVVVDPIDQSGTVNVDLLVKDRFAFRPIAGANNTGTQLTEEIRFFAGAVWGKPFGRSDILSYQYTAAPNPRRFHSHSSSYQIFLPWKHELTLSGAYGISHPKVKNFSHEAINVQASVRYAVPLKPLYQDKSQTLTFGIEYKNLNSNVFYIEKTPAVAVAAHQVNVSQGYASYLYKSKFIAHLELFISPGHILPHESDRRYQALRPDSRALYGYGRAMLKDNYRNGLVSWMLRLQGASGPLLPSEQFGLGGVSTVRGYGEKKFLADHAICANVEFTPLKTSFFKKDEFFLIAFSDFGFGMNDRGEQADQKSQYLWSAGLGASYRIAQYFSTQVDYGMQLHHLFQENTFGMLHLSCLVSY